MFINPLWPDSPHPTKVWRIVNRYSAGKHWDTWEACVAQVGPTVIPGAVNSWLFGNKYMLWIKFWDFLRGRWLSIEQHPVAWFSKSIKFPKKVDTSRVKPFISDVHFFGQIKLMSAFYYLKLFNSFFGAGSTKICSLKIFLCTKSRLNLLNQLFAILSITLLIWF